MFIAQVIFSTSDESAKEILLNKAKNAKSDFEGFEGLIDAEVWKNETKSKVEYSIVSKWDEKKSFQNWVSRPSHVEEHKKMRKEEKEQQDSLKNKIEKTLKQYELFD